ncbi:hypothetical protein [Microbacterium sp.]|uniref:hypothetical protein n=1 Tax=Microbacterium sp. TaxID=51671 RepID=UPI003A875C28
MRKYLFGTGLFSVLTAGLTLLREGKNPDAGFTWRTALAWLSWGITLALAVGAAVDTRRATQGRLAPADSPISGREHKLLAAELRR